MTEIIDQLARRIMYLEMRNGEIDKLISFYRENKFEFSGDILKIMLIEVEKNRNEITTITDEIEQIKIRLAGEHNE